MSLHDHLPPILLNPGIGFLCMCAGLGLLYMADRKHMAELRQSHPILDESGTEYRKTEKSRWLIPVLLVLFLVFLATPILAVGYSLAYKGAPPARRPTPIPPAFAYKTTPRLKNPSTVVRIPQERIAIAPNGIANAAPNLGTQTVNNINADRKFTEATADATAAKLASFASTPAFISCAPGDSEQQQLARQLRSVLVGAKWDAQLGTASWLMGRTISGIEVQSPAQYQAAAQALADQLTGLGMTAYVTGRSADDGYSAEVVHIIIGAKR